MSRIYFYDTYIAVIPTYEGTDVHKHSMLHVFVGEETLILDDKHRGNLIILEQNVYHRRPKGNLSFFLFVDPTSTFAENLRKNYLKGDDSYADDIVLECHDPNEYEISDFVKNRFGESSLIRRTDIDSRITFLLDEIDRFECLETKVPELAVKMNYSESYLTHLFKKETGVSLKRYLLLRRVEYVWKRISCGESITSVSLDAGFSSPSHFSDTCRKLTGISAADVLR